jgi:predicted aldo/keto reductase-like oxidoreductase
MAVRALGAGGEAMMIDQFVFEAAKKRLDDGAIVAVGFTTHGRD